jgi:hypothetical protein
MVAFLVKTFAPEARDHGVPEVMDAIYYQKGRIRPIVAATYVGRLFFGLDPAFNIPALRLATDHVHPQAPAEGACGAGRAAVSAG